MGYHVLGNYFTCHFTSMWWFCLSVSQSSNLLKDKLVSHFCACSIPFLLAQYILQLFDQFANSSSCCGPVRALSFSPACIRQSKTANAEHLFITCSSNLFHKVPVFIILTTIQEASYLVVTSESSIQNGILTANSA